MALMEAISGRLSRALMDAGLVPEGVGTFLTEHALYVQAKINDDELRRRNIMEEPRLWKMKLIQRLIEREWTLLIRSVISADGRPTRMIGKPSSS